MLFGCHTLSCVSCYFVSKTSQGSVPSIKCYSTSGNCPILALGVVQGALPLRAAGAPVVVGSFLQSV